ncbi:hypothetical protein FHX69_0057 [Prauserella muralis]|nr:hypothetical protein FHX69_0057 [Prauserella muralis]
MSRASHLIYGAAQDALFDAIHHVVTRCSPRPSPSLADHLPLHQARTPDVGECLSRRWTPNPVGAHPVDP